MESTTPNSFTKTRFLYLIHFMAVLCISECTRMPINVHAPRFSAQFSTHIDKQSEDALNIRRKSSGNEVGQLLQRMDTLDTQGEDYLLCRKFFKKDLCNKCFPECTTSQSHPSHSDIAKLRNNLAARSNTHRELTQISSVVMSRLLEGACALESTSSLSRRKRRVTTAGDVDSKQFVQAIYGKYGTSGIIHLTEFETLLNDLRIGKPLSTTETRQSQTNHSSSVFDQSVIQQCFLASDLAEVFNASEGIPEAKFAAVCPSLIQQITEGCVTPVTIPPTLDVAMYGWATLAVASITVLSMLAMAVVPTHGSRFYAAVMQLFVAVAVSSLSGDALLHLLPEALGIHGILKEEGQPNHILIILTVILAVYFFFIFERVMSLCLKGKPYGHGHVHSRPRRETFMDENCSDVAVKTIRNFKYPEDNRMDDKGGKQEDHGSTSQKEFDEEILKDTEEDKDEAGTELQKPEQTICGLNMLSVMVMIGDVVHNITDGVTIGVSFINGPFAGVSTTIAVFFHEVPHEIGDFAVMLRSGVSFRKAMLCSLFSNLMGFVGLYAGLLLGNDNIVQRWIFAATAGMFLYIALVSLVPEMNQQAEEAAHTPWKVFLRHNIGLLLGWAIMLALGVYEQNTDHLF